MPVTREPPVPRRVGKFFAHAFNQSLNIVAVRRSEDDLNAWAGKTDRWTVLRPPYGCRCPHQLSFPVNICQYMTQSARNDSQGCANEAGRFFS